MADFKANAPPLQGTVLNSEAGSSHKLNTKKKFPPLRSGIVRKPMNISDESLPMVIIVPSETECMSKYAIPLESVENEDEMDNAMKIIEILNLVNQNVRYLEEMYDCTEQKNAMDGDFLSSFLTFCNRNSSELSSSIQEEHEILESLLAWFENELLQLQEPEDEEDLSQAEQTSVPGTVEAEVLKIKEGIMKLTELKNRFRELPKLVQHAPTKGEKRKKGSHGGAVLKTTTSEDTGFAQEAQEIQAILQSLQSESKIQSVEVKQKMMQEISKLIQKQTTRLQKQDVEEHQKVLEELVMAQEAARAKEELKVLRSAAKPVSMDTVTAKFRQTSTKYPDSSTSPGKTLKKLGSRTSDPSQQAVFQEPEKSSVEEVESQKEKETPSVIKKASARHLPAATESTHHRVGHGGRRPSISPKAAKKASSSQASLNKIKETQRPDKRGDTQETVRAISFHASVHNLHFIKDVIPKNFCRVYEPIIEKHNHLKRPASANHVLVM
ncbi:coiled-coil domain-containing protein 7 [Microcaecilia unicolor]|uniref:Coiled-coil domain-containing protein 7 n=1 Tax=Microcaecilia unicolor TaxID=1415580 RepID=A0A6P7XZS8_9AMPH|nr:coiled-coil domain-containing protein 7 [Microcaecilia unicolor]